MARTIRNSKIDTRSARSKLPTRKSIYWTAIAPACALGYRKGAKGGVWIGKFVRGDIRREITLGPADDAMDADGTTALNYSQAQERARAWFSMMGREGDGEAEEDSPYTVADAVRDYMNWFREHRKSVKETGYNFNAFVLSVLGDTEVAKLTTARIRAWHNKIAQTPPRKRTRPGEPQQFRDMSNDPDTQRRRRFTANHVLANLKAALNYAWRDGKTASDEAWRRVIPFKGVDTARVRYLSQAECVRLVNACTPDFRPLVQAALYTGCRYSELAHLTVADFDADAEALHIRESKTGKARHVYLSAEGLLFFDEVTAGRSGGDMIFVRLDGKQWRKSHQIRRMKDTCKRAKIEPPIGFHIMRHCYASMLVMNGAPLMVVAQNLGHADTRMVEKHYGHLAPSYVADTIRAHAPKFGIAKPSKVARIGT